MIISHNLSAINAHGRLVSNTRQVEGLSEKLSSGYRINRAADDASGLAVSEKLRSQLRGLHQASRNCQDGISIVQTFDGALEQSHSIIQRAKELAAEAANGTYDNPTDRAAVELEYKQLCDEINNIADTDFNGLCMLNGGILASKEDGTSTYWADPTDIKWQERSLVNNTDDPDFNMTISKLPALDELTIVTADEKEALLELNGANVAVEIKNGSPTFSFNAPVPKYLTIETRGVRGIISMNTASGLTAVAEVRLPNTTVEYKTTGKGTWGSTSNSITITPPKSNTSGASLAPGSIMSDSYNDAHKDNKTTEEALRREYHDWLEAVPTQDEVQFQVTDDREHFRIIKGANTLRLKDGTQCSDSVDYDIGTELFTTTNNKGCNTSGKDHEWDWSFTVSWNKDTIMPGNMINFATSNCADSKYTTEMRGATHPGKYPAYYDLRSSEIFGMGSGCQSNGVPTADTNDHGFWLLHGGYSFSFTYTVSTKKWTASLSDGRTGTRTYNEGTDEFNKLAAKLGVTSGNLSSMASTINSAHDRGYFNCMNSYEYPNPAEWPRANRTSYTFQMSINAPRTSYCYVNYWSNSYNNGSLNLGDYNPANPDAGGIDQETAVTGTYTYVNPDLVNTETKGYWINQDGDVVDLEEVGIHLPLRYSKEVLSSTDPEYNNPFIPLHTGMSITISTDTKGPTGTASAIVNIWEGDDHFKELINTYDVSGFGLTYSENLILQTNSRSKDAVNFTFRYSSPGVGELLCDTNCSAKALGMSKLTLSTQEGANTAIDKLDHALNKISMVRACFGSINNRLEKKVENIAVAKENATASESHIRDTDMASTMINFTKAQLLSSVSQSMLAQSNLRPQQVLQLLG